MRCRAADNLKSAVIKADRCDPGLNRTHAEMAAHYGTAILPARPRKLRDKAKVEVAVQVAQRWIVVSKARLRLEARLRNHRFFSLAELNVAIRRLSDALNMRVMRGYGASRADLFATLDRPNLQTLPPEPYVFARQYRLGETRPCCAGLSRRSRQILVFRSFRPDQARGRRPHKRPDS